MATRSTITRQSSREAIRELQRSLIALGFNPGRVDGVLGRRTQAAIVAFQRANGLDADGKAGPQTQRALYSGAAEGASRLPRPRPELQGVRPAGPLGAFPAAPPVPFVAQGVRPSPDPTLAPQVLARSVNPQARGGPALSVPPQYNPLISISPQAPQVAARSQSPVSAEIPLAVQQMLAERNKPAVTPASSPPQATAPMVYEEDRATRMPFNAPSVPAPAQSQPAAQNALGSLLESAWNHLSLPAGDPRNNAGPPRSSFDAFSAGQTGVPAQPGGRPMSEEDAYDALRSTYAPEVDAPTIGEAYRGSWLERAVNPAAASKAQSQGMSALRSTPESPQAFTGTNDSLTLRRERPRDIYDQLRPKDIRDLAFTIAGEIDSRGTGGAAYGTPENRQEIADITQTIMNRSRDRELTPSEVVTEGYGRQYNAWLTDDGRGNNPRANSARALKKYGPDIYSALNSYFTGDLKPTNTRIDHYLNRNISNPKWARSGSSLEPLAKTNQHTFYGPRPVSMAPLMTGRPGRPLKLNKEVLGVLKSIDGREQQAQNARRDLPTPFPDWQSEVASRTQLPTDPRVDMAPGTNRFTAPSISDLARGAMPPALNRGSASQSGNGILSGPFSQTSPYRTKDDTDKATGGGRSVFDTASGLARELFGGNQRPPAQQQTATRSGVPSISDLARGAMPDSRQAMGIVSRPQMPGPGPWARERELEKRHMLASLARTPKSLFSQQELAPTVHAGATRVLAQPLTDSYTLAQPTVGPPTGAFSLSPTSLAAQYRAYGSGRVAQPPAPASIPVVAPPQTPAQPPVMAQAPVPTVPTVPPPAPTSLFGKIGQGIDTGLSKFGATIDDHIQGKGTWRDPVRSASMYPNKALAYNYLNNFGPGPNQMQVARLSYLLNAAPSAIPTAAVAQAPSILSRMFGGDRPRNERGQFTSGGSRSGNYGGSGSRSGNYGGGSRYHGPGSGGYTNRSGGA